MKRFKVTVRNEPKNMHFVLELLATDEEHAKKQAFQYASEQIASFMTSLSPKASWSLQREEVAKVVASMMDDSRSPPFWNPETMTVHVAENTDPIIKFAWDLINKPKL